MTTTTWTKPHPDTGHTLNAVLIEQQPGAYLVSTDLMHQLLTNDGWT